MLVKHFKLNLIFQTFQLLEKREKVKFVIISATQVFVNFLDLLGITLIGILGSMTVNGIQSKESGTRVMSFLRLFKINEFNFQNQVAIIGIFAAMSLISRTLISVYLTRKVLFFMGSIAAKISSDSMSRVLNNNLILMQSITSQNMIYSLTNGVNALTIGLLGTFSTVISDLSLLVILTFSLYIVSPSIAITTTIIFGLVAAALYFLIQKRAILISKEFTKLNIDGNQKIYEIIISFREIFTKNRQAYYAKMISKNRYALANSNAEMAFLPHIGKYIIEITLILCTLIVSGIQFIALDAGRAIATLTFFIAAGSRIAPAVLRIQQGLISLKTNLGQAEPTLNLMNKLGNTSKIENYFENNEKTNDGFTPSISVSKLNFNYPGSDYFKLNDISVSIEPGKSLAIVGPSGSGKSTFVDLIIGLQTPTSGTVLVSGLPPSEAIKKWPGSISYVAQETIIVNGTIKENVCLGYDPNSISDHLVSEALNKAQLKVLVESLPKGLDNEVGERGAKLSGGQRQRLGIARALLNKPKIIILDEATSSMDSLTENEINQTIEALKDSVTLIIIAHRLSSVKNSDKVIYINNGNALAIGTFDDVRNSVPDFDKQAKLMGI